MVCRIALGQFGPSMLTYYFLIAQHSNFLMGSHFISYQIFGMYKFSIILGKQDAHTSMPSKP
ncbi:hypothetical protein ACJX0J_006495, partial [Zea mays]